MADIRNGIIIFLLILFLGVTATLAQVPRTHAGRVPLAHGDAEVEQEGQTFYAVQNLPLVLPCGVRIRGPVQELRWLKDGTELDKNKTRIQYSDLDLRFERVVDEADSSESGSDQGTYQCVVKISSGVLLGPPQALFIVVLENNPEVSLAVEGVLSQHIILPCHIHSVPAGRVRWIHPQATGNSRLRQLSSGDLVIQNLRREDAGEWRCEVQNLVLNEVRQSTINLVVNVNESAYDPEILDTFPSDVVLSNETLDFICLANGNPRPSATWVRYDDLETDDPAHFITQEVSLGPRIWLNKNNGSSYYACIASVESDSVHKGFKTFQPPTFSSLPVHVFLPPRTVRLDCKSPSGPAVWYKDGLVLERNKGRVKNKNSELVISNTIRNDSGYYQCESGRFIFTTRLIADAQRPQPDSPTNLTCVQLTSRAIQVSWDRGNVSNFLADTLHFTPVDGGAERQQVTNNTTFVLEALTPNTNYSIYVKSYSGVSASPQSAKVYCSTLEDYPLRGPRLILPIQVGPPTQFHLRWTELPNEDARGKIIFYKLQWRASEGSFSHVLHLSGDTLEFIITELEPSTLYEARILPATSAGYSPDVEGFAWTNFETASPSNQTFDPPELKLTPVNSSRVLISWEWPSNAVPKDIEGYRLFIGEANRTISQTLHHPPLYIDKELLSYTLSSLNPETKYVVSLQAFAEDWESRLETQLITGDQFGRLIPISGLVARPRSSTEILLEWKRPDVDEVDQYVVNYNAVGVKEATEMIRDGKNESVKIQNLAPYQSYEFEVAYKSNSVEAPFSQKVEARTKEGIPGLPIGIQFEVVNTSSIRLSWSPPIKTNGIIRQYLVQLTKDAVSERSPPKPVFIRTNTTEAVVGQLERNKNYIVRVSAETAGGRGEPSTTNVRIYTKNIVDKISTPDPTKDPPHDPSSQKKLGIILGVSLSLVIIFICGTIIVFRNQCFPYLLRRVDNPTTGPNVNGRRGKDTVDGPLVEMEVLRSPTGALYHLDTKGGHPNGLIPNGVSQPLLSPAQPNPDEESGQQQTSE